MDMSRIGWITNCHKTKIDEIIEDLILGFPGRIIQIGRPKAGKFSAEQLEMGGMVGLYDVDPSQADQVRGFPDIRMALPDTRNIPSRFKQ